VTDAAPRASVIIPAYYSDSTIEACLDALRAQTFQGFETIVVNSSPEERTREIVARHALGVVFVQSPVRLLPHAARNHGAERARGGLLVFTDPDCRPRPEWLERLISAHDAGHAVVGGAMGLASTAWFERGVHLCKFSWALEGLPAGEYPILPTASALYAREVWAKLGPFDGSRYCGDALHAWRAAEHGWRPWFEPRAVVEHRHLDTAVSLWHQRLARGEDFARARMEFEGWSRGRAAAYVVAVPLALLVVLGRSLRDAARSGWLGRCIATLPVQLVGQLAWCLGEARAASRYLGRGASRAGELSG
jgi:GT2 family glycosyltransferase